MTSESSTAQSENQPSQSSVTAKAIAIPVEDLEPAPVVEDVKPESEQAIDDVAGEAVESQDFTDMSTEELLEFARGQMLLEKFGDSVQALSTILERKVPENDNDPLHPSLAEIWVLYGQACYKNANAKVGLLGDEMLKNASSMAQVASAGLAETGNAKISITTDADEFDDEDADGWEDDEQVNEEEVLDDFAMAWEAIETARVIYSRLPPTRENRLKLAEVHQLLGDMSLDEEKYDQAIEDYRDNLKIKEELYQEYDRFVSEARYVLATAFEGAERLEEAAAHYEKAVDSLQKRQVLLENTIKSGPSTEETDTQDAESKGKGKVSQTVDQQPTVLHLSVERAKSDLESLVTLLPDLKHKVSEIQGRIKPSSVFANPTASSTSEVNVLPVRKAAPAAAPLPVNDISGLVKKRKADDADDQQKRPKPVDE